MIYHDDFIPVGFQYYRAPTPLPEVWERDLAKIKADGFNTVKYWIQWRWSVPEEGVYYFEDTDRLMDLAEKNGLKVIINTIFDVTPSWFLEKHSEASMVTNFGRVIHPMASPSRQIGGEPSICFHHPAGLAARLKFLEETVKHYSQHPALYCWDLWNEPEIADNLREPIVDNLLCYCGHSINAFRAWLQKKYGSLEGLNAAWMRNYRKWEHVEVARSRSTFNDMIDWRMFMVETLTTEMRHRANVTRQHDKQHPVMCHTVPPPIFNSIMCGSDDWGLANESDLFGNSLGSMPLPANLLKSAAKGRKLINSEIHAIPGMTLIPHARPSDNDMLRHIFVPLTQGVEGFVFWQYRPETLGLESPAWGSVDLEGNDTPWHSFMREINRFLQTERELIIHREDAKPQIGIYIDPKNEIFTWIATGTLEMYFASIQGTYRMLYERNYDLVFLREADLHDGSIDHLKAIFIPPQYYFNQKSTDALTRWVEAGGLLVSEPFIGSVNEANGIHSSVVPGLGLDKLFGVKQAKIVSSHMLGNSYDMRLTTGAGSESVKVAPADKALNPFEGWKYLVDHRVTADTVKVLATYDDGTPAITANAQGKGYAVISGTPLGWSYHRTPSKPLADFIDQLLQDHRLQKNKLLAKDTLARVDVLRSKDRAIIVVDNHTQSGQPVQFADNVLHLENIFDSKERILQENNRLTLRIPAGTIAVYKAKLAAGN